MSSIINNGNRKLILRTQSNTSNINNENLQVHQKPSTTIGSKLQAPLSHQQQQQQQKQHQRQTQLPHVTTNFESQLTEQQSVTTAAAAAAATTIAANASANKQQITQHQQQHLQQHQTNNSGTTSAASLNSLQQQQFHQSQITQTTNAPIVTEGKQPRRSFYQLQSLKSLNNQQIAARSIPPRYQPPPQPSNSGAHKHLNTATSSASATNPVLLRGCRPNAAYYTNAGLINLKYPPDIPQITAIPESIKTQSNQSQQYLQQRQAFFDQNQRLELIQQDMLKFVRKTDQDQPSPSASVSSTATGIQAATVRLTAEQNRQLQSLINELSTLKEQNQRLLDDNQELRDLCCFLDDDRQKGRKLAREWQRFGRYTASVMRQEVAAYQNKLRQLDDKQQELITDNLELKELCLYLDEERAHVTANSVCTNCGASTRNVQRDDGDGSSSSTNADDPITALRNYERQLPEMLRTTLNDQTLQYVRSLERRIQQLEEERLTVTATTTNNKLSHQQKFQQEKQSARQEDLVAEHITERPEAVVRALQVLEVREQLERNRLGNLTDNVVDQMDDGEKALVREMCNVVWRKLENSPNGRT